MKINVRMKHEKNTRRFARWAAIRIDDSFSRFSNIIRSIDAFFADLNGPKGGHDKNLLLAVRMRNGQMVAVRAVGDGFGETLDGALNRGVASLRKQLDKQHPHRQNSWQKLIHEKVDEE
jgi:hypothetical protein